MTVAEISEMVDVIIKIFGALSSVAVAILTYVVNKDSKIRKLQAQINAEKEKAKEEKEREKERELKEQLSQMEVTIQTLSEEVKKLRNDYDVDKIELQFKQLKSLNEFNFGYMQNLSKLVISIGDAIVNSSIVTDEETLKDSISLFKSNEIKLMQNLYKIIS